MTRARTLPLPRGATIGIMGGGQLGRMLAMAAARLGFRTHIFAPAGDNPAFAVAHENTEAAFDDEAALKAFAAACDVITYEWENVPVKACDLIEQTCRQLEEQAKRNIDHEFEQARKRLKDEVLEKAMARAEEIITNQISSDDQERLVDEYLDKVVA